MTKQRAANLTTSTVRETYEILSGKASDIVRQLSLAGVALIWIFKMGTDASAVLPTPLIRAGLFIFIALFLDLLQYLVGTAMWYRFFRSKERENVSSEEKFEAPIWMNWPTWTAFWLKSVAMMIAYALFILPFLARRFIA